LSLSWLDLAVEGLPGISLWVSIVGVVVICFKFVL
jgi:hypothetical protein